MNNKLFGNIKILLNTLIIDILILLNTLTIGSFPIIATFFSRTGNLPHLIARLWARLILIIGRIPVKVQGQHNLVPDKPFIYMANHQSNVDIPVLLACLPVQFRWLAKAELFKIPLFGRSMKSCGYISIDRSNRKSAFESLSLAAKKISSGTSVMIFPEGTRGSGGKLLPFKKGGFILAIDAGVPIIPVIIQGTGSIMPKGSFLIRHRPVVLKICKPIATTNFTRKTRDDLLNEVKGVIQKAFESV